MKEPTAGQITEFAIRTNGITQTITSITRQTGNESAFVFELQAPVSFEKQVTLTYVKGTIQAQNEAFLGSFVDYIITNTAETEVTLVYPTQDQTGVEINLTLRWETVTGASGYNILFGNTINTLSIQNTGLVTDTWYTLREMLSLDTAYYWRIEAVAANGATVTSDTWGFHTSIDPETYPVTLWRSGAVIGQYETVGEAAVLAFHGDTITIERGRTVTERDTVYIPYGLTVTATPVFSETDRATLTGGGEYGVLFFGKVEWLYASSRDALRASTAYRQVSVREFRSSEYAYCVRNLNIIGAEEITGITITNPLEWPSQERDMVRSTGIPGYIYHTDISGCRDPMIPAFSVYCSSVYAENVSIHHNDSGVFIGFGELLLTDSQITDNGSQTENTGNGGLYAYMSTASVIRSTLSGNYSGVEGAGFCAEISQFTIDTCDIEDNVTPSYGSGVCVAESQGNIRDSTISGNISGQEGGGLYAATSTMSIADSECSQNTALTSGSGLFLTGSEATLSSLTIDQNECFDKGGGVCCEQATVSVLNSVLSGNKASLGGGFYASSSTVTVHEYTIITDNETRKTGILDSLGGGLYFANATGSVEDATITSNTCRANDFVRGGGIYAENSDLIIRRAEIKDNALESPDGGGAGVYCSSSGLTIENSLITANTNLDCTGVGFGGGVGIQNSEAWIRDTSITGNTAKTAGGGIFAYDVGLVLSGSRISENQVNETDATAGNADGGGILAVGTDATITESEIRNNRLYGEFGDGAGLFSESSAITIEDAVITENEANALSSNGGGILAQSDSEVTVFSTLIASNTATEEGGGVWIETDSVFDTGRDPGNVRIVYNTAGTTGGGIYFEGTELYTNIINPWNGGTSFSRSNDFFVLLDGSIQDTWDENSKGTLVQENTAATNAQIDWQ
jgi:predicted outer membrane repeat protein